MTFFRANNPLGITCYAAGFYENNISTYTYYFEKNYSKISLLVDFMLHSHHFSLSSPSPPPVGKKCRKCMTPPPPRQIYSVRSWTRIQKCGKYCNFSPKMDFKRLLNLFSKINLIVMKFELDNFTKFWKCSRNAVEILKVLPNLENYLYKVCRYNN